MTASTTPGLRDPADRLTHIERLNPIEDGRHAGAYGATAQPADYVLPFQADPADLKPFRLLRPTFWEDRVRQPGEVVMATEQQAGAHMEVVGMSDAQFATLIALLKEMLTPGYELAKRYLAEAEASEAAAKEAKDATDKEAARKVEADRARSVAEQDAAKEAARKADADRAEQARRSEQAAQEQASRAPAAAAPALQTGEYAPLPGAEPKRPPSVPATARRSEDYC